MVHPLCGKRFMASEHERQSGARRCAASLENSGGLVEVDRAFAADDTQQRVLVQTGFAGNLVTRLARL